MHPVTLSRIFEVCAFAQESDSITTQSLSTNIGITVRRSREILNEMVTIGMLNENNNNYFFTEEALTFYNAILHDDLNKLHIVLINSPFYSYFYNLLQNAHKSLSKEELLTSLNITNDDIHFNNVSVSVLCDWGERISSIQRNVFTNRYYIITLNLEEDFSKNIIEIYKKLSTDKSLGFTKTYIEIPLLRESVCEYCHITRKIFDHQLIELYRKNIGKLEFSGAPTVTNAKRTNLQVKRMYVANMPDRLTLSLTSDEFLKGIELLGKSYYYFAYHGGTLSWID